MRLLSFFVVCSLITLQSVRADTPETYDLRSAGPGGVSWVPAIQDQGQMEDCWTFATATALDSALIKAGYLPTSTTAPTIAISSWHLSTYNGSREITEYISGTTNRDEWGQWGGFYWQSMAYLTRGSGSWAIPAARPDEIPNMGGGPVLVTSNTANAFPLAAANAHDNMDAYLPPVVQPIDYQVTAVHFFNQSESGRDLTQQIAKVKEVIQNYGAAATYMYADGYTKDNHNENVFHRDDHVEYAYLPADQQEGLDHAVTIIGWDDNIQVPGASVKGAWIVQNSWGAWGGTVAENDGTFYAAYDDKYIGRYVTAFKAKPIGSNSSVVLQNEVGPLSETSDGNLDHNGFSKIDASRGLTAVSLLDTHGAISLTEVGAYSFGAGETAVISLYGAWSEGLGPSILLGTKTVTFEEVGYTSFVFDTPIDLSLYSSIVLEIAYDENGIPYVRHGMGPSDEAVPTGLSFFYDELTNEWTDFASLSDGNGPGVFFAKGIVAVPEPSTGVLFALGAVAILSLGKRFRQKA